MFDYISKYLILSAEEKKTIIELDIFKNYKKGEILLKEGQLSINGYFVIKGCIRCYCIIEGEEKTTAFYTELEMFSPICSINKMPSEHYIACVEDSIIVVANSDMENLFFKISPF